MTQACGRMDRPVNVLAVCLTLLLSSTLARAQEKQTASPQPKTTRVLFLCPHGAAKSVLASTYFRRLAKERGLNVIVDSAGTDPDPSVSSAVATHLAQQSYPVSTAKPRLVTADDLATADVVVSLGCDLTQWPTPAGTLVKWDDVPGPSEDFAAADDAIRRRVTALVDDLVKQVRAQRK